MNPSRRTFIKSAMTAPVAISGIGTFAAGMPSVTNKYEHKFKISLNTYSFNDLLREGKITLFDVLEFCAKNNFDAIDPTGYYFPAYPEPPSDDFLNEFKRKAFLLGVGISGTGIKNDFANPDPVARKAEVEWIKKWILVAVKLGAPALRIFAGTNNHEGFSRDEVFEWMARDIRSCCEAGKENGVVIALQNHNDFIKTSGDVERIFNMVNSEWLGLNLDIGSFRQSDPYEEIEKTIKYAVTWQIKENVWINGKETATDFKKLTGIIKKAGYRGYLPVETLGAGDPYMKIPVLLEKINDSITTL